MNIQSIKDIEIKPGTRVLVRSSLNVPIAKGVVTSGYRLRQAVRTIDFLKERQARVIVIGHLGRDGESLRPVYEALKQLTDIAFVPLVTGAEAYKARQAIEPGTALLLENTRSDSRETDADIIYAEELVSDATCVVFDDFSAAHRAHASTTGIIQLLPSYAGISFYEEITGLLRITERLEGPSLAIVGGAKGETKIPVIKKLLNRYKKVFVAGVLANTILQQKGISVGASKVDETKLDESLLHKNNLLLPVDFVVTKDFSESRVVPASHIENDDIIVDIGDESLAMLTQEIAVAKTVMMNGPTGWYEKGFSKKTLDISKAVRESNAYSFMGGGDTVTMLEVNNQLRDWTIVSTGGGSLLLYLAGVALPVLTAFTQKSLAQ